MTVWLLPLYACRAGASDLLSSGGLADQAMQAGLRRLQQVCGALKRGGH